MKHEVDIFKIKSNKIKPEQGMILVSEPFNSDRFFQRSVVLLLEHNKSGTVGLILNKPTNHKMSEISEKFNNFDSDLLMGGPVSNENIYYIHTLGKSVPGSTLIKDNLYMGGNFDIIQLMISGGTVKENQVKFFAGYSGWASGQLQNELSKNFWLVTDIDVRTIMNYDKKIWGKTVNKLSEEYRAWANFPENPIFN